MNESIHNIEMQKFNVLPLAKPGQYVTHVNDKLCEDEMCNNIGRFKNIIMHDENYALQPFAWYDKKVPLLIKYLYWKGVGIIVPWEEICQISALQAYIEGKKYTGNGQPWHEYADAGFDVMTTKQFCDCHSDRKSKNEFKGLVLVSIRPGSKFHTRKIDNNDPLNWEQKKKEFDMMCACCGAIEGDMVGKTTSRFVLKKATLIREKAIVTAT